MLTVVVLIISYLEKFNEIRTDLSSEKIFDSRFPARLRPPKVATLNFLIWAWPPGRLTSFERLIRNVFLPSEFYRQSKMLIRPKMQISIRASKFSKSQVTELVFVASKTKKTKDNFCVSNLLLFTQNQRLLQLIVRHINYIICNQIL